MKNSYLQKVTRKSALIKIREFSKIKKGKINSKKYQNDPAFQSNPDTN